MDGPTTTLAGTRRCPQCDRVTDEPLCPADRTVTLLIQTSTAGDLELGSVVARYELEQLIGRGGFGAVYRARHLATGQHVALKVLSRQEDDIATKRFFQEAQVTSRLRHPNTIRVFDFGQDDAGRLYIAMELLSGRTLRQAMRDRQHTQQVFSEGEAAEIGVAILKSLAEAHREGLVHRDIKPDNIFLHQLEDEDPVVKVLDFGVAKLRDSQQALTSQSAVPGTPTFMSPEQALNRELDGRSDLYSVGVLLYLLVAARAPFRAEGALQTLYMHVHMPVPDLAKVARTPLTPYFVGVVQRALEKDPDKRFASARDMRAALEPCLGEGWLRASTSSGVAIPSLNPRFAQIVAIEPGAAEPMAPASPPPLVPMSRQATSPIDRGAAELASTTERVEVDARALGGDARPRASGDGDTIPPIVGATATSVASTTAPIVTAEHTAPSADPSRGAAARRGAMIAASLVIAAGIGWWSTRASSAETTAVVPAVVQLGPAPDEAPTALAAEARAGETTARATEPARDTAAAHGDTAAAHGDTAAAHGERAPRPAPSPAATAAPRASARTTTAAAARVAASRKRLPRPAPRATPAPADDDVLNTRIR